MLLNCIPGCFLAPRGPFATMAPICSSLSRLPGALGHCRLRAVLLREALGGGRAWESLPVSSLGLSPQGGLQVGTGGEAEMGVPTLGPLWRPVTSQGCPAEGMGGSHTHAQVGWSPRGVPVLLRPCRMAVPTEERGARGGGGVPHGDRAAALPGRGSGVHTCAWCSSGTRALTAGLGFPEPLRP